jgi:hypothetical protein
MKNSIPSYVAPCLWSYDISALDLEKHRERVITNVLNYGSERAVHWLFVTYPREIIASVVANPRPGEWDKKSLAYWAFVFDIPRPAVPPRSFR